MLFQIGKNIVSANMGEKRATDHFEPTAKKRVADRQIAKDDVDDELEEDEQLEPGIFQRAPEEVLKQRKIIKARRGPVAVVQTLPASANPFVNITLAAPTAPQGNSFHDVKLVKSSEDKPQDVKKDEGEKVSPPEMVGGENKATTRPTMGGFGSLASGGTGLMFGGKSTGGFGSLASESMTSAFGSGASTNAGMFSFSSAPALTFNFSAAANSVASNVFGSAPAATTVGLPEEQTATGEENEDVVFSDEGALYEFDAKKVWRERGKGEIKVLISKETGQGRVVMRQKGNLRLLLNANLWKEMQLNRMDGGKGVTFAVINHALASEEAPEDVSRTKDLPVLATFALRLKTKEALEGFIEATDEHKLKSV